MRTISHADVRRCRPMCPCLSVAACLSAFVWLGVSGLGPANAESGAPCAEAETTVDMRACLNRAYERADGTLNAVWKKVMASLAQADHMPAKERKAWKETLLASQRAWIVFKENDCDAVGFEWWGGSGAGGAILDCLLAHTTARTKTLKLRYLDN